MSEAVDHDRCSFEFTKARWFNICVDLGLSTERSSYWWSVFHEKFSEPHRRYHNWMHILHLYVLLREYSLLIEGDSILLELCILFHDLIYDPTSKSNEEDSAKLFMQFSTETTLPQESSEFVQRVILDTKNHTAATPLDADAALFLDLDLTILASEPHLYDEYAKQVREEYSHVTDEQFRAGRGAFLRKMLDVQHIFHTPYFRDALEPTARANMERELNKLSQHGQST